MDRFMTAFKEIFFDGWMSEPTAGLAASPMFPGSPLQSGDLARYLRGTEGSGRTTPRGV
jgi:hypothetical protein